MLQCLNSAGRVTVWDLNSALRVAELVGGSAYEQFGAALAVGTAGDREVRCKYCSFSKYMYRYLLSICSNIPNRNRIEIRVK